jgi:hypothetical protein
LFSNGRFRTASVAHCYHGFSAMAMFVGSDAGQSGERATM